MTTLVFTGLPAPPSANTLFVRPRRGVRAPSRAYKRWQEQAGHLVRSQLRRQQVQPVPPRTPFECRLHIAIDRRGDLDNRIKPTLDLLQKVGVFPDDRWCDLLRLRRETGAGITGKMRRGEMCVLVQYGE